VTLKIAIIITHKKESATIVRNKGNCLQRLGV
jgi:hypothetical protein